MPEFIWKLIARLVAKPRIAAWLIRRAQRTPYFHLLSPDGRDTYMRRWWLFNPYDHETRETRWRWCPISIRVHHICTPDLDRDLHDHPWNARTIILEGGYLEVRSELVGGRPLARLYAREPGDTAPLDHDQYHSILDVAEGGAYTLFITGRYRGGWGFMVGGVKVPWREYVAQRDDKGSSGQEAAQEARNG